jgi:hypothetical protein
MSAPLKLVGVLVFGLALAACSKQSEDNSESGATIEDGGDTNHPAWIQELAQIKLGATRRKVEALLPKGFTTAPGFGSSGMHREFYTVSNAWQVSVVYRSPDMRYIADPKQLLIDGPFITRLDADTSDTYRDPRGSFIFKKVDNQTNR